MDPIMLIALGGMLVLLYFITIRPENKKKKDLAEMRARLSVGDSITTAGGIIGKIVHIDDEKVTIETSEDRVRIQLSKWAVSAVGTNTAEPQP